MATINPLTSLRAINIPDGCGCAITKAEFTDLSPATFANMGDTAYGMQKVYRDLARARTVGVAPSTREMWLMSNVRDLKQPVGQRATPYGFVNLPYTMRFREANITNEYFKIREGTGASTGGGGEWTVEVETINDPLYDAPNGTPIHNQFIPGQYIYVRYKDSGAAAGSQTSYVTPFKVEASNEVGGQPGRAQLVLLPSITEDGWNALTGPEQAALQPQEGIVTIGVNNVDDYEQFCVPESVEIAPSQIVDYHQTSRNAFCYEKEYLQMMERIEDGDINEFYRQFLQLPVTQQNRQREQKFRQKWYQAIYDNGPINELQSPEIYNSGSVPADLTVVDPSDTNCILGYKANALGIRQLLKTQGQVIDFKGGALNLNVLFEAAYGLKRNRELEGQWVAEIGGFTSRKVYDAVSRSLVSYIKKRYGDTDITRYYKPGELIDHVTGISMRYIKFDLPEYEFTFVLATDNFFTDREAMLRRGGQLSHAGTIEIIDWTDFELGIVKTNKVDITEKDEWAAKVLADLQCTMTQNTKFITLDSTTWTARFGNEKRSLIVEGFNPDACIDLEDDDCIKIPTS